MSCTRYFNRRATRLCSAKILAMRLFPLLVVVANLVCHPAIGRAEMISGMVLSLDQDENQVVLAVETEDGQNQEVTVLSDAPLPPCAEPGKTMRAWGSFNDEQIFVAHDLRGPGRHFGKDPTGVRSRLRRYHSSNGSAARRSSAGRRPGTRHHRRGHK